MARQTRSEREQEVREQYEAVTDRLFYDRQAFSEFLAFSGKHYKLPSDHAMMIFHVNPAAEMVTDYDTWRRLGRQVERGQKSVAVFENGKLMHYFDISQTAGSLIKSRWHLDKETATQLVSEVSKRETREKTLNSVTGCVDFLSDRQTYANAASLAAELNIPAEKRKEFAKSIASMVRAVVAERCRHESKFTYKGSPLDLSALDMLKEKSQLERLTGFVQKNAKAVLLSIEKTVNDIQRRNGYEREQSSRRHSSDLVRGGQRVLPRNNRGGRQDIQARSSDVRVSGGVVAGIDGRGRGADEQADRLLRSEVAGVYGAEPPIRHNGTSGQNEVGFDTPTDRQGSRGNGLELGAGVRTEQSTSDNISRNSKVGEDEAAGSKSQSNDGISLAAERVSETAEAEIPTWEFVRYAYWAVSDNLTVQNAHENSGKDEFTLEVEKAVDDCYTRLIAGEVYDGYEIPPYEGDRVPFYNKYHRDSEYRAELLSEIITKVDEYLLEIEEGKRKAAEIGMPFSTKSRNSYEDFDPYAYDGSMSVEDSRKAADAHNLDEFMSGYSEELEIAAATYSSEEFEKYFVDKAAKEIANSSGSWLDDMRDNPEYLKEVCKLVSREIYNELWDNSRQAIQETAEAEKAPAVNVSEKSFAEQVDEVLNGTANRYNDLKVCDTPQILLDVGCEQLPMLYTQQHLRKAIQPKNLNEHTHGLDVEQMKKLPSDIANPVMILDSTSRNDSIIMVLQQVDKENCPIVVSVKPNGNGKYNLDVVDSNFITSVYGRENFASFVERNVELDNILYCNKEKSQELFRVLRLQFPQGVNNLDSDIIIHQSRNIVKGSEEKISEEMTAEGKPQILPSITCNWSESSLFEDGKTYSVAEFDSIMAKANKAKLDGRAAGIEKYGSEENWREQDEDSYFSHLGYDKTKFTVNFPDGSSITERQDIGDGYGGVIEFLAQYSQYTNLAEQLRRTVEIEIAEGVFVPEVEAELQVRQIQQMELSDISEERATYSTDEKTQIDNNALEILHSIEPRKSVMNFTHDELTATSAFADSLLDIGEKSPYYRAEHGEWRNVDNSEVSVVQIEDRNVDFKAVREDIKSQTILRGTANNPDTGWDIQISRTGLEDTVNYGQKFKDKAIFNALYHIEDIVKNCVLLDTVTSERNNKNKAYNTEFMHKLYGVFDFNGDRYIAKLTVEEFPDANFNPLRRLYNLQDIKIESLKHIEFKDNPLAQSVFNDSMVSISQLFQIVKYSDKDFYVNKSQSLDETRATYSTTPAESNQNASQNFRIAEDSEIETGGLKAKFAANIAAIQTLKKIESENRTATSEEQAMLAKYAGWGGLPQAFNPTNEQWSKEYNQLRELLTDEEYSAAAESTLNAHYTSPEVIDAMYKALENFGFKGGNLLEPALGTGRFFGCMPEKMQDSSLYGVELDSITGRIAQQLYPQANVQISGFEKAEFPDNFFDAAIGNVPFGNYGIADRRYDKEHFLVHDYFFAKTLDKVAPNGIVAFITSKGTLDKANPKVREYLAKRADLIGAIRLPNNAFKGANTEVTSDIIFLQKREKMAVELPNWCYTAQNSDGISVNQYFIDHPEMVLGKLETRTGAFGQEVTCSPIEGEKLSEQLDRAVAKLRAETRVQKRSEKREKERGVIPATADVRNFTHTIVDGKMYFRENNIMTEVKQVGKDLERMKGLHELRQTMRELIEAQNRSCSDEELIELQKKLNTQYDGFTEKFGSINDRQNANVFREDDDYNTLCSLEIADAEKKTVKKSDVFTQRTIKPITEVTRVNTPQEAMQVSVDIKGELDIQYMSALCGQEPQEIIDELIHSNMIYLNPTKYNKTEPFVGYEESSEYLSGNVREKLRIAEATAKDNPELFGRNVTALNSALPPTIEAGDISSRIGASWIDIRDYEKFLTEYLGRSYSISKLRRTAAGEYKLENKTADRGVAATNTYGTECMSAYHIFENLLNHRDNIVRDRVDLGAGVYKYVINQTQTDLATEKAKQMQEAFSRWLWGSPERREKYVTRYNELFNSIVGRHYDGSYQTFPEMSPYIQLKPHQKDAVMRAKFGGNTLLAHCVGAGKSFEMIAATMEKKRLGLINKACVVVPKSLVGQTANEWLRLYPQAKILVAGDKDFSKDNRQKFIGRCCTGDYAAVIMSYEQFEKIPMSTEYRRQFLQRELDTLEAATKELGTYGDRTSIKDSMREQKRIKAKIEKLLDTAKTKDNSLTFEQLGFDSLVVDEAHNYKNGLVVSKMSNVSGVQTTAAQKSEDILMKTQYLNETTGSKNILFATGTPVTNSMTELYTMQRYLRPELLNKAGLQTFDDWAGNFGEVVSQLEMKPAGDGYRTKKRFARFTNLPELMQMYNEFADIRTAEMLKLPVPEINGGKPQTIVAKPNEFQRAYVKVLAERSEAIHNGSVDPTQDNMLKLTHEARLLGLDARTINPAAENSPDSKVNLCIDKVMEIYNQTTEQKGVQAIFCDIAVNSDDGKFSVYDYIKEELTRRGIPANEICTAGDAKNQEQRSEMFAKLRSGQKRIVIASTSKLGTGANIQTRLAALHNLDIPWKPSDLEQRNGRIIRQGNTFSKVDIFNYVTENTFDAYMMNIIVTKQKFISQLMSGKTPARTCEDVDEMVLNYSEIQALATGDPRIKEKIELDGDVARLRMLESEHYNNKYKLEDVIKTRTEMLHTNERRIEIAESDKAFAMIQLENAKDFNVTIGGKVYNERATAGNYLDKEISQCIARQVPKIIGEYMGFELSLNPAELMTSDFAQLSLKHEGGISYTTMVERTNIIGNISRMENVLKTGIDKEILSCKKRIENFRADIEAAQQTIALPFEYADELSEKTARLDQLNKELGCGKTDEVFSGDEQEPPEIGREEKHKPNKPKH